MTARLDPTHDHLYTAGFRQADGHKIVKRPFMEQLNTQLASLVGENGAEMPKSLFKSRRSISGPELT